ncbi:2818_t:CDS:1 [Cetraspora pellucida]|uniref:2818_t:CDS:1 n=1 Tax=Cetraspora pellucida TaxID=1433469 RepID=A0ACA9K8F6_9GLOM|nr:2818_t:CDS:1 [Cetraspora pellucida]
MILNTCKTTFINTNELTLAIPLSVKFSNSDNNNSTSSKIAEFLIKSDNESDNKDESNNYKKSINFEYNIAVFDEEKDIQNDYNTNYEEAEPKDFISNNSKDVANNLIQKLFTCVFVNDS